MNDALNTAIDYVREEYHKRLGLRDGIATLKMDAIREGNLISALTYELTEAQLRGEVEGLNTAIVQLQMVREREVQS